MKTQVLFRLLAALLCAVFTSSIQAQSSAFTYQGSLSDAGSPASGSYDLRFALYDDAGAGNQQGVALTNTAVPVVGGVFTVTLDFGSGVFDGSDRWLEIGVVTNGGIALNILSPRQPIVSVPYAIRALTAGSAGTVSGTVDAGQLTGTVSSNNIAAGSITSVQLADGAVGTDQLAENAVTANKVITTVGGSTLAQSITNPAPADLAFSGRFGIAVSSVGNDKLLIGADGARPNNGSLQLSGAAYLFAANGTLLTTITNPTPEGFDLFGNAVSGVGNDKLLIGAYSDNTGVIDAGAAYLYDLGGTLLTTYTNPTPVAGDRFGGAVSGVGSDKVLIAAYRDGSGANAAGIVYLYDTNGTLLTTYTNPTPGDSDLFGISVSGVGSDKVLIGAYLDDTGSSDAGAAYLYDTSGTLLTTYIAPFPANPFSGDRFGTAVAGVGSDKVLIGASSEDNGVTTIGAAYLYDLSGTLLTAITNPTPSFGDKFGDAVSGVGSDKLLIGASWDDTGTNNAGAAYLYDLNGTLLATFINPTPASEDEFGIAVSGVGSDQVLIGAYKDDEDTFSEGAAYLYDLINYTPGLVAEGVAPGSITSPEIAPGAVTADKVSNLDAASLTSGTLNDSRLSSNVARLDATQTFTENNVFNAASGNFSGDGSGLTALNASQLSSGFVPSGRISGTYSSAVSFDNAFNTFTGDGSGLSGINSLDALDGFPVDAVSVDSGGNVGIGTSTPESRFDVRGGIVAQVGNGNDDNLTLKKPGALSPSNVRFVFSHRTTGDDLWLYGYDGTTFRNLQGWNNANNTVRLPANGQTLFADMTTGRVGVGTSSPATTLHVNGTITGNGGGLTALNASALSSGTVGSARISGSYNNSVTMGNTANVFSGKFQGNPTAPASAPSFTWSGDTDSGLFRSGADTVALATGGAERMRINSSGEVGIGTTAPEGDVHIRGNSTTGSLLITPNVSNSRSQILLTENTSASLGMIIRYAGDEADNPLHVIGWNNDVESDPLLSIERFGGNVGIGIDDPTEKLHVIGNILATGTITPSSDRNLKKNFDSVDAQEVLERVTSLPIQQWTYKAEEDSVRHVGPMAQDFHAAFGFGANDTTIATVDADGVALAAIQGLNEKVEVDILELKAENAQLRQELQELKTLVMALAEEGGEE